MDRSALYFMEPPIIGPVGGGERLAGFVVIYFPCTGTIADFPIRH